MAKLYKFKSESEKEYKDIMEDKSKNVLRGMIFLIIAITVALCAIVMKEKLLYLCAVPFFIISIIKFNTKKYDDKGDIRRSGIQGELQTLQLLERLPDDYHIISNALISCAAKTSEMDTIVIGPTGVFVIETKNNKGTIHGHPDSHSWVQIKYGKRGTRHTKELYNPIKQVNTHVYVLANLLRSCGCNVYVKAMVLFVNYQAKLTLERGRSKIPVFSVSDNGEQKVLNYILSGESIISKNDCIKITNDVLRHCNNLNRE